MHWSSVAWLASRSWSRSPTRCTALSVTLAVDRRMGRALHQSKESLHANEHNKTNGGQCNVCEEENTRRSSWWLGWLRRERRRKPGNVQLRTATAVFFCSAIHSCCNSSRMRDRFLFICGHTSHGHEQSSGEGRGGAGLQCSAVQCSGCAPPRLSVACSLSDV